MTAEALSALRKHLVPLFDTMASTLVVVVPTNKVDSVAAAFDAEVVKEDALEEVFPPVCVASGASEEGRSSQFVSRRFFQGTLNDRTVLRLANDDAGNEAPPPKRSRGAATAAGPGPGDAPPPAGAVSVAQSGSALAFAWANKGCDCPRCERPAPAV